VDDVTKRVFDLAKGCLEELYKQKEYIILLEAYIEELENGVEVSTTESVQLEQPMEMEETNESGRPRAVRARTKTTTEDSSGRVNKDSDGTGDGIGGSTGTETPINNLDK
jgi:hypothetical protein